MVGIIMVGIMLVCIIIIIIARCFFLGGWDLDQGTLGSVARLPVKLPYEFRVRRGEASGFEV